MALWFDEVYEDKIRFGLKIKRTLFSGRSPFQKVDVVETEALGCALLLDELWMTAEKIEKSYHEYIVHPTLTTAPSIERVLIIGGGDGGTAREVLRYPGVKSVQMVEIDGMVVQACKDHLPDPEAAWDDPRLEVIIGDGIKWVAEAAEKSYDVVIVDGSDPVGPAVGLFDRTFYANCARILKPEGVFVSQAESPTLLRDVHLEMLLALEESFQRVHPFYGTVSIYPGGAWGWVYASQSVDPLEILEERIAPIEAITEIYNRDIHRGAFAVPNHIRRGLEERRG